MMRLVPLLLVHFDMLAVGAVVRDVVASMLRDAVGDVVTLWKTFEYCLIELQK